MIAKLPEAERGCYDDLPTRIREIRQASRLPPGAGRQAGVGERLRDPRQRCGPLGATSTSMSVLREEDAIALALLPANQRYFAEVPERDCRIALINLGPDRRTGTCPRWMGDVARCCISTTCAPPNVVLYRRMRATLAEERRGAKARIRQAGLRHETQRSARDCSGLLRRAGTRRRSLGFAPLAPASPAGRVAVGMRTGL